MNGERQEIVLLHGFTGTFRVWDEVIEAIEDHAVRALPAIGHRGGRVLADGETYTIERIADALVEDLDTTGLAHPHIVGNSMGGRLALELAARGRAASVMALCPAGFWDGANDPQYARVCNIFHRARRNASLLRPALGAAFAIPPIRRYAFRDVAQNGERLSRSAALEAIAGVLDCRAYPSLLTSARTGARTVYRLDCPVAIRLAEHDRFFAPDLYTPRITRRIPAAELSVLPDLGHIPMIDDPRLIAKEIEDWVHRVGATTANPHPAVERLGESSSIPADDSA